MRARSFFYVSAGLFLLALGYHLGAHDAEADFANGYFFSDSNFGPIIVQSNGAAWNIGTGNPSSTQPLASIPTTYGQIVASDGRAALTSTGYVWYYESSATWRGLGYAPAGPTPVQRETMGNLKARYR